MIKILFASLFMLIHPAQAVEVNTNVDGLVEYTYDKSIIYVFHNNTPCQECEDTIRILTANYNDYYKDKYDYFVVNYEEYPASEYQNVYNLNQPLTIILAKVKNGVAAGTYRIDNLQVAIADPTALAIQFRTSVGRYFSD